MPKLTVLVVDDDLDDIEMLEEALQEVHSNLVSIPLQNGREVLQWLNLSGKMPDLIFLDLNMPPLNGYDCLIKLKEKNDWKHIPVIIYTTSNLKEDKERCVKAGASHFITKPSNFNDLVGILSQLLKNKLQVV